MGLPIDEQEEEERPSKEEVNDEEEDYKHVTELFWSTTGCLLCIFNDCNCIVCRCKGEGGGCVCHAEQNVHTFKCAPRSYCWR